MMENLYIEKRERRLAAYATRSTDVLLESGASRSVKGDHACASFEGDKDFILRSSALRKLGGKSQNLVFRTLADASSRLFHTLQVMDVASRIARGLCLNVDLTEAIALGHDIGHMPFSHNTQIGIDGFLTKQFAGKGYIQKSPVLLSINDEKIKNDLKEKFFLNENDKVFFAHQKQSFHVFHNLEHPEAARLTINTQIGILHNYVPKRVGVFGGEVESKAVSFEMLVVEIADYITWPNNDLEDAINKGFISADKVYSTLIGDSGLTIGDLGGNYDERVSKFVNDVIDYNLRHQKLEKKGYMIGQSIQLSPTFSLALDTLKDIVLNQVLEIPIVADRARLVQSAARHLFQAELANMCPDAEVPLSCYRTVCDKIWRMSDYEFIDRVNELRLEEANALQRLLGEDGMAKKMY